MTDSPAKKEVKSSAAKRAMWTLVKYGIGLGLLVWVVWSNWDGPNGLKNVLQKEIHFLPLVLGGLLCAVAVLVTILRWFLLVRAQGLPFTLRDALRLGLVGFSFSTLLPGSVGGDVIKAAFLVREQSRRTIAVATVLFDRILGLTGLVWLTAILGGGFWLSGDVRHPELTPILIGAWGICLGLLIFWLLLGVASNRRAESLADRLARFPKIGGMLAELWRAVWMYRRRTKSVLLALSLAMLGHMGFVTVFYFASLTINNAADIPNIKIHYLIVPVGMVVQAGFPLPGGIGGAEFAFGELYELAGKAAACAVVASLIQRAITWCLALLGYLASLLMPPSWTTQPSALTAQPAQSDGLVASEL